MAFCYKFVTVTLLMLSFTCTPSLEQMVDLTLDKTATGADVVRAVQAKLDGSQLFDAPSPTETQVYKLFIREAAYVESLDGAENSPGIHEGGIWRVSRNIFHQTQQHNMTELLDGICRAFCIDWMNVRYSDLSTPLHSGIAISIHLLHLHSQRIQVTASEADKARFWVSSFGNESRLEDRWLSRIAQLRNDEVCTVNTDIVFVLDASGSVGNADFQAAKGYVYNFTESLLSGDSDSRVGVITYSNTASVNIELASRERETLLEQIRNLPYTGGSTNTPDALCLLKSRQWRESLSVLRIVIVLTDGKSNKNSARCSPGTLNSTAEEVHSLHPPVTVFAVGVSNYDTEELLIIASDLLLVDELSGFDARLLEQNQQSRSYFVCFEEQQSVTVGEVENGAIDGGGTARFQATGTAEEGVTVRICIDRGVIKVYGSYTVSNPNFAINDFSAVLNAGDGEVAPSDCLVTHADIQDVLASSMDCSQCRTNSQGRKRRQSEEEETVTIYIAIEGVSDTESQFSVNSSFGDAFECAADSCVGQYQILNRRNGSCVCECVPGYERQGQECINIDECTAMPDLCGENGVCTDTSGNHTCGCLEGYEREGQLCANIDECTMMPDLCGENGVCTDTSGNHTCGCLEGYEKEGELCANIDECTVMPDLCGENGVCTDTSGNYTCGCLEGYEKEGELCANIDECTVMLDLCGENGVCTDTSGNYTCGCLEGYADTEGELCINIDECTVMPDICRENEVCTDTNGSYTCGCQEGNGREGELCTKADEVGLVTAIVIGVCCGVIVAVLLLALVVGVLVYRVKRHPGGNKSYEVPVTFENHQTKS